MTAIPEKIVKLIEALTARDHYGFTSIGEQKMASKALLTAIEEALAPAQPVAGTEASKNLRLAGGKFYRRADGERIGPMFRMDSVWYAHSHAGDWLDTGKNLHGFPPNSPYHGSTDLVAEWDEVAPAQAVAGTEAALEQALWHLGTDADRASIVARGRGFWTNKDDVVAHIRAALASTPGRTESKS